MLANLLTDFSFHRHSLRALSTSVALLACTTIQAQSQQAQTTGTPSPAASEQKAEDAQALKLKMITVSSERTTKNVLDVPMSINVIDRDALERHQVRDIQDLVRYEPGVNVDRQTSMANPFAQLTGFNIRGVGGNRVQMLVDGARVQERVTDGSRDFVDPFNMKSVEITRGPNSVLWGADALGGVVFFRTLDPDDLLDGSKPWAIESKLAYDSFDKSFRKQITGAAEADDFKILGSFGHVGASEPRMTKARADGGIWGCPRGAIWPCNKTMPMDVSAYNGLMKLQWDPGADHQVKLTAEWFERRTDIDQKYDSSASKYQNESYDRSLKMQRSRFALEHRWSTPAEWLDEVKWSLSYSPQKRDTFGDQIRNYNTQTPAKRERYETIRNYSEKFLQGDVQLTSSFDLGQSHHKLIYGFAGDYTKTDYDGTNITTSLNDGSVKTQHGKGFSFPRVDTVRADIYLQDEIKLLNDRLTITPGLRLATYSIDPTKDDEHVPVTGFSPEKINKTRLIKRLGATYKLDDNYSVFGSYGEAFKMPTSSQLFSATESTFFKIIPNPNLKPESVQSYEAGIRGEFDRGYFSLSGFYSDYDDFIQVWQLVPGTANTLTSYNYSSVKVWGIELGGEYEIYNNLYAHGSLSYMRGDQRSTPDADRTPFDGATPLTTVLGLRYFMPDWNLETEFVGTFAKGPSRRANPNAYKPSGYAVFDAYARWKPTKSIDINFGVENIFDKRYFPNTLTNYANTAPSNVANANPLELQTAAGRTFKLGATMRF
ncbi:hemoglobin/transferrin/lactoferrin receptor protein [Paenochrobactrum gallinarii]|uniref:Heme transporter BhuA n=1 Tax=Paenochrobactrum gallinarii TaxID=643673 RepID=A0A841M905_9HYPH|nr:TonB-dependent hemoglobin/transferrin/lactoferrin family receptor [Paenochrobactrum gallinarii]MBB6262034.1 hemoglobin/transferrin/lactoferrin receptor protein [Paenochrobactrum gallinarii]